MACGLLVPQTGIKPVPPAVEVWSLNHWTAREVPIHTVLNTPSSEGFEVASAVFHTWFDPVFLEPLMGNALSTWK